MRKHTPQFLNRVTILLILYLIMVALPVFAGSSDTWKSCCSSDCDYSPGQTVYIGGRTYYCCSSGWQTSSCPTTTIPQCRSDSDCPAIDTDGGYNIYTQGTCYWRYCSAIDNTCKTSSSETDYCFLDTLYEWYPDSNNVNYCTYKSYDCNNLDCSNLDSSCTISGSQLIRYGDDYGCSNGACSKIDKKACESYTCDSSKIGTTQTCAGTTYYCCSNGWQTSACPTTTTLRTTTTTTTSTTTTSTTTSTTSTSTTTTTIPQCTSLTLNPSSGPPSYTVTPSVAYSTCKICDYQGCSGSSCKGTQISTDNNPFTAPSSPGTYGYYACPGGGYATITVTQPTTTTTSTTTSTTSTTSTTTSTTTSSTTTTTTTTTTLPPCSCSRCDFYSSSNCDNACSEWQNCTTTTCSASGCISNSNCYKCEWKPCSQVSPKVYILTPFIASGGDLTVSVYFECNQWSSSAKNLTLSLKIDGNDWNECFLNKKGLMTDFGWDSNCDNTMSRNCGSNNQWSCDSQAYCKHQNYDLWVKSNFNNHYVNVTFTCKLPYLTGGTHYLNVTATVYSNEVTLKPTTITFRIEETDGRKILEILSFPIKILRNLLPF